MRGELRIYLGAAPGVGKTFAMLNEGWRRHQRGTDVVIGYLETHGRARTAEQVRELEIVPRQVVEYRGGRMEEMDVDAILDRRPDVALIDELAHTNVPGSRHEKRWEDVDELLDAGIMVITTVNVQHLESLNDVVEQITGVKQRETVPDEIVRAADQVEMVDMTPEAIRRRMAHGNIYPSERVDAALSNYFRPGNLAALRELALLWLADQVEAGLQTYMEVHGISAPWETRERVVVALTGAPSGEHLVRRAARMARRSQGDLIGVHIRRDDGLAHRESDLLESQKQLLASLGGTYHEVVGSDVSDALVQFSHAEKATQLVLGASRRSRLAELAHGSIINKTLRSAGEIDVHVISEAPDDVSPDRRGDAASLAGSLVHGRKPVFAARRRMAGWAICVVGVPLLTIVLLVVDTNLNLTSQILLYLALVAASAAVGGRGPGLVTAVVSFLAANWFFTPPVHTLTIGQPENLLALVIFLGLTLLVSVLVSQLSRRQSNAARSRAEAEALARTAGELAGGDPLSGVLAHVRTTFQLQAVAVLARDDGRWRVEASAGNPVPERPEGHMRIELQSGASLVLVGGALEADDLQIIRAFANQLDVSLARQRLEEEASRAAALAEADHLRTSILRAVSHDLRTPLASVTASVTSLLDDSVRWSDDDRQILLQTIREETDRLSTLVANLLDMSRIEAGALDVTLRTVGFDEVVPAALSSLTEPLDRVQVDVDPDLPALRADPALLERVVANLVSNALRYSPVDRPVLVTASAIGDRVELRVIDRGPGIPRAEQAGVFEPFQRLGDQRTPASGGVSTGVGLGLAVARGFVTAMRGELLLEDTPGGGLTTVLALPAEPIPPSTRDDPRAAPTVPVVSTPS